MQVCARPAAGELRAAPHAGVEIGLATLQGGGITAWARSAPTGRRLAIPISASITRILIRRGLWPPPLSKPRAVSECAVPDGHVGQQVLGHFPCDLIVGCQKLAPRVLVTSSITTIERHERESTAPK